MSKFKKWMKASLLISGLSIILLFIVTVNSETIETVLKIKYEYIILAVIMHMVAYFMWALRTKSMSQGIDYKIKFLSCVKIVTASKFAASITPSSIGGEPLRIELLHQNELPIGRASAIVLGERFMDALLILFSAPMALYILRDGFSNSSLDIIFIMGEFILVSVLLITLYGLLRPGNLKRIIHFIAIKLTKLLGKKREDQIYHVLKKIDSELYNFHASLRMLLREGRISLVCGMLFTVFYWLFLFSILPVILMGLNQNPPVIITFAAQILLLIITAVPITPGASGVAELGASTLFSIFVVSSLIGVTVVTWRALTYYMNLLVGGFVSIKIAKDTELINRLFG
ncbi:flippase-like domain-containing protein [Methanohalobium sp.]|uniref:lysylphosphatidylglycerol synthase transmembrane domain-containing protein n=1 Tax=Methanohalobium sp. TaxID=2837493 RepID=UPI0025FD5C63|nr:flippase-like domain-containing protein [Methanohalobium sp.]